jgi:hypothetical protein
MGDEMIGRVCVLVGMELRYGNSCLEGRIEMLPVRRVLGLRMLRGCPSLRMEFQIYRAWMVTA